MLIMAIPDEEISAVCMFAIWRWRSFICQMAPTATVQDVGVGGDRGGVGVDSCKIAFLGAYLQLSCSDTFVIGFII